MRKKPGKESVYLSQIATGIGVRETRRILGEYVVTEQDAIKGTHFPDVIAISSNPMPGYHGQRFFFEHEGFDIPYRSLVPKKVEGLVLTGRCISCEQAPFQSARSMAPAMAIGHASGCAAALAAKGQYRPAKARREALAEAAAEPKRGAASVKTTHETQKTRDDRRDIYRPSSLRPSSIGAACCLPAKATRQVPQSSRPIRTSWAS